ncbi:MAG: hypothetical protein HZA90_14145 [Verrucomicrobia bacterium]|nr:hypothetical protein [Verrucomicrobiota bacterium]
MNPKSARPKPASQIPPATLVQDRAGTPLPRRAFLAAVATSALALPFARLGDAAEAPKDLTADERILSLIESHRPSRLTRLPADFRARVGAAHVAGKYCLTQRPFLLEGAEKLLELGTQLGKFWFIPDGIANSYPFHSQWGRYRNFVELAKSDYFQRLFALPFSTLLLEAHSPAEHNWRKPGQGADFYEAITQEFHELTAHLYQTYRDRALTLVLQHWEGDWLLRGAGEKWNPPPADWRERCERMQRWLAARQAGVSRARAKFGPGAKCVVAHAAEVNRVADAWKNIPTMTEHVLPGVELDLVSYSAYDGLSSPLTLWKCIAEIRRRARTGPLFGQGAVYVGEIGVPENDQPQRIAERFDEWMGAMLAADVRFIAHWELYCNEFAGKPATKPPTPVTDPKLVRGFWLVKPDGSLSEGGQYFQSLWQRAARS